MAKKKELSYMRVAESSEDYKLLDVVRESWHARLEGLRIGLCWCRSWKQDKDGNITLGQAVKASDLHREFEPFDAFILLNEQMWDEMSERDRAALLDHELCHFSIVTDKDTGKQVFDERGRVSVRMRNHDLEEFHEVFRRHGAWRENIVKFLLQRQESSHPKLFPDPKVEGKVTVTTENREVV